MIGSRSAYLSPSNGLSNVCFISGIGSIGSIGGTRSFVRGIFTEANRTFKAANG
jgi:hypothetical protein